MVRILRQEGQQIEFPGSEVLFFPIDPDPAGGFVNLDAADLDNTNTPTRPINPMNGIIISTTQIIAPTWAVNIFLSPDAAFS